jgi:hypothetical protein
MQKTENVDAVIAEVGTTLLNVKPAVGSTPPSAGVTPAPSDKSRNVEDDISLSGSVRRAAAGNYLARYFTGEAAGRNAAGR